jgi:hypothetical protein
MVGNRKLVLTASGANVFTASGANVLTSSGANVLTTFPEAWKIVYFQFFNFSRYSETSDSFGGPANLATFEAVVWAAHYSSPSPWLIPAVLTRHTGGKFQQET